MFLGLEPLVAYALVGIGAAAYSPAKYGILGELAPPERLIKANGMLESSNSIAMLLGVVAGGYLADQGAQLAVGATVVLYAFSGLVNLGIPPVAAATSKLRSPGTQLTDFFEAMRALLRDPVARFSLIGTSVVIGLGSTLRFLLVAWVPVALGIPGTAVPAALSGAVAIGITVGAVAAARHVTLTKVDRALPAGLAVGALTIALGQVSSLPVAASVLVAIGVCGGYYVVPLKAVLQNRGKESVGAGCAISVQSIFNNISMLAMAGAYTAMTHAGTPPVGMAFAVGVSALLIVGLASWARLQRLKT
jgi:LPLT family lysophospholipid transporter-like MFS transporter